MQINQLPTIPQAPANADVLAIEVGGVTYKIPKSTLASAILGTIDSAPTQSSANLVKSGGVYNAVAQSTADINNNGLSMRTNLAKGTAPSATQYYTVSRMFQAGSGIANTDRVGELLEASIDSSGTTKTRLGAYQFASGSSAYNAIDVIIDKDGNKSYAVSDPDAFRSAISTPKSVKLVSDSVYTDFDDLWQNGNGIFSIRTRSTNQSAPVPQSDAYWYVFQATMYANNGYGVQIATRSTNNYNVYMRKRINGTNNSWIKITFENIT